jgi:diguanylate cyclase (GGDEF)-like protein
MTGGERRRRQDRGLGVGRLRITGVLASEPAGKSLRDCEYGECLVTYDAGGEDQEVRRRFGVTGLRRLKLLRIATEAHEQGIDLTQEDLAYRILNCGLKTIKRDIAYFRKQGLFLPTRGQQKDIGPVLAHQVEAVRLSIEGKAPWDIARKILHPPRAISRYLGTFARAVTLADSGADPKAAANSLGLSERVFRELLDVRDRYRDGEHARRLAEVLQTRPEPEPARGQAGRARLPIYDEQVKVLRREFFEYLLGHEMRRAARYRLPLTLLAVEIDRSGRDAQVPHTLFNRVLAEQLRVGLRKTDIVGRLGPSRFGAILAADAESAARVAERIRASVAAEESAGAEGQAARSRMTVSIGAASIEPGAPDTAARLAEMAQLMLTQAREGGGNRTLVHAFGAGEAQAADRATGETPAGPADEGREARRSA